MKQRTLIIEEYEFTKQEYLREVISRMVQDKDVDLSVRLKYYQVPITRKLLNSVVDTIKDIGKNREFFVEIILETDQWKNIKHLYKVLNQYAVSVELLVSEKLKRSEVKKYTKKVLLEKLILSCNNYSTFYQLYQYWKEVGLSIKLEGYRLSENEYFEFWEEWIHDSSAVWFLAFENLLSSRLIGKLVDCCEYSSCMGKYLYIDKDENVYFCEQKKEKSKMYSLKNGIPKYIFNTVYDRVLDAAVEKRSKCKETCSVFPLCRGGCPLDEQKMNCTQEYLKKVVHMDEFLGKELINGFANIENPCFRQFYLSLIAYGYNYAQ